MAILIASLGTSAPIGAASTDPIQNDAAARTLNQPNIANPIYYPIAVESSDADAGVTPETILRLFMERHTAMDYPAAAELAMRLITRIPDRPEGHYNLACALSRLQRSDEALNALSKAIDLGWRDLTHINFDPDLKPLHESERYKTLLESLKSAINKEAVVATALRQEPWEVVAGDLQQRVPALLERHHVPGAAVALIRDGEVVWTSSFGVGDRRIASPLASEDRFRVRAPMHLLAIIAAGQQESLGRLQLAKLLADGAELNDSFRSPHDRMGSKPEVAKASRVNSTAREASIHSKPGRRKNGADNWPPNYSAGSVYSFIRLAMEMTTGQPFPEYCEQSILKPLSMHGTGFTPRVDDGDPAASIVIGHSKLGSPMDAAPQSEELAKGGSLYTTAGDLSKLLREIMRAGDEMETIATEQQPHTAAGVCSPAVFSLVSEVDSRVPRGLGLAIEVRSTNYGKRLQVADVASGIGCLMRWYPNHRCGVVVLVNSETGREAAERIAHAALGGE